MPSVFLIYSRDDLSLIEQLEARLKTHPEISIWRDQEKIYGGQKWPKVLGEAIADQDVVLLAWSKHSAASHFVEFEWCTALALKKTIIPCLLDSTALPHSLAAINAISVDDLPKIVTALTGAGLAEDIGRRAEVVSKLDQIKATKSEEVLNAARMLFDQRNWAVQGNVYQAAGNIYVTSPADAQKPSEKSVLEKWQTWVAVIVGVLTALSYIADLPGKFGLTKPNIEDTSSSKKDDQALEQRLAGSIRNEASEPITNVQVSLPKFGLTTTTNNLGQFDFRVTAPRQETVGLLAQKSSYEVYENDFSLGNTDISFTLKRKP